MKKLRYILAGAMMITIFILAFSVYSYAFSGRGSGTWNSPFMISTAAELREINLNPGATYKLANDIDLQNNEWIPLDRFYGILDGNNFMIKNLKITNETQGNAGLFSETENAYIGNVKLYNVDINVSNGIAVGSLVGYMFQGMVEDCSVIGTGSVHGSTDVGGLIGHNDEGNVFNSFSTINVSSDYCAGGLIGRNGIIDYASVSPMSIVNSSNETNNKISENSNKTSSDSDNFNAVVIRDPKNSISRQSSFITTTDVYQCYATGTVSGGSYSGGLIGIYGADVGIDNARYYGESKLYRLYDCFSTGDVSSNTQLGYKGGLVGAILNDNNRVEYISAWNCYSSGNVIGSANREGLAFNDYVGSIDYSFFSSTKTGITTPTEQARTESQLKTQSTFTYWDFSTTWDISENLTTPFLRSLPSPFTSPNPLEISGLEYTSVGINSIELQWNPASGATSYDIYVNNTLNKNVTTSTTSITGLNPGTTYIIFVKAKNDVATGNSSATLTVTTRLSKVTGLTLVGKAQSSIDIKWNPVEGATSYDVYVNGEFNKTSDTLNTTVSGLITETIYNIQVKAKSLVIEGELSDVIEVYLSEEPEQNEYAVSLTNGEEYSYVFSVDGITDLNERTFIVKYDPSKLTLVDFAAQTKEPVTALGIVKGTNLQIISNSNGVIVFKNEQSLPQGSSWSGVLTIIKFRAKETCSTSIYLEQGAITPTANPVTGVYIGAQYVTLSYTTPGATIRYTIDGSEPTSNSIEYTAPIPVPTTTIIKAKAFIEEAAESATVTFAYIIKEKAQVATPISNLRTATYMKEQNVTLSCATSGATIRYTTDGTEPTNTSTIYNGPIHISTITTIKVKAFKSGMTDSATASFTYTIIPKVSAPTANLETGTYTSTQKVTLNCSTSSAK